MARIELSENNGWVPEETSSSVITVVNSTSAVEAFARKEQMASRTKSVPRYLGDDAAVVAEAGTIPESASTLDEVVLTAVKFANRFRISEEDLNDGLPATLDRFKEGWAHAYARKLDNAALGVTAVADGTTKPYNSVYYEVSQAADVATRRIQTAGDLTFEDVSNALGVVEAGDYFDPAKTMFIAHPSAAALLRNLKDGAGARVITEPLNGTPGALFGYPLVYSHGAKTHATASATPTGNALIVVGNADHLILGVRSGIESQVTDVANWATDEPELKVRARRGFAVGKAQAFAVIEKTAGG